MKKNATIVYTIKRSFVKSDISILEALEYNVFQIQSRPKKTFMSFIINRIKEKIKSIFSLRHLVPAIFVLTLILLAVIAIFQKIFWPILFFGGIYLFMNITFSIYESIKNQSKSLILLPVIYFIMHLSYGIGFLAGLVFFANRWRASNVVDNSFKKENFALKVNA